MSVFLITSGLTFLLLCLLFIWAGNLRPDWKTVTVSAAVGAVAHGISLIL